MSELTQPPPAGSTSAVASDHTGPAGEAVVFSNGAAGARAGAGEGQPEHPKPHKRRPRRWLKPSRLLTTGGLLVTLVAGVVALTFTLDPGLSPCIGGSSADFSDMAVISNVSEHQYEVVLELYNGLDLSDRLALTRTQVFQD